MLRVTTMRRAMVEGVVIFAAGQLIALIPASFLARLDLPAGARAAHRALYVASGLGGDAREVD